MMAVMMTPMTIVHMMMVTRKRYRARELGCLLLHRCCRSCEGEACRRDCGNDDMPDTHKLAPLFSRGFYSLGMSIMAKV